MGGDTLHVQAARNELRWLLPSVVLIVPAIWLFAGLAAWEGPTPWVLGGASLAAAAVASRLSVGSAVGVAFAIGFLFFLLSFAVAT